MSLPNPLVLNDCGTRHFFLTVFAIQVYFWVLVGVESVGPDIPIIREFIGFSYLTFIPGVIILKILKLHKLGIIETLVYSVGLSLAFIMLLGLFVNTFYPMIGISQPISEFPVMITLTIAVFFLCVIAYIRDRQSKLEQHSIPWSDIFSLPALFLSILPFLAIIGSYYLVNFHQNNIVLMILLTIIALVIVLVAFSKFIPQKLYPWAVVSIAISLLLHYSLTSHWLIGWDIQIEHYFQDLVISDSSWDKTLPLSANAMLSITMLSPIYAIVLDIDALWVLRIVYPILFSLVPLVLFQIFRKQTDEKTAFVAVFFFMSFYIFFVEIVAIAKQQIAELFFALCILLLLDKVMTVMQRTILLVIFGFAIILSHYGLSYFYLFYLLITLILLYLSRLSFVSSLWTRFTKGITSTSITNPQSSPAQIKPRTKTLSTNFLILMGVFSLAWFMYTASGAPFEAIVDLGDHVYDSLSDFFLLETRDPNVTAAIGLGEMSSVQREIARILQYVTQVFIIVGVLGLLSNLNRTRFHSEYIAMTFVSLLIVAISIITPYIASGLSMTRIYHITLVFLAPFCVLGGITTFRWLIRLIPTKPFRSFQHSTYMIILVLLILIPYFLFNTGYIFEVSGDKSSSIALNPDVDAFPHFNEQEISGEAWLLSNMNNPSMVFADNYGNALLNSRIGWERVGIFWGEDEVLQDDAYIYLRSWNIKQNEVMQSKDEYFNYIDLPSSPFGQEVLSNRDKIYDSGDAYVYR